MSTTEGIRARESSTGRDATDLAGFGYRQRLDRTLGGFSSFAAGFSYLSILTGLPQLFYLGFGFGGPAFFWTWPTVLLGQSLVALCFAELAAEYPLSGGVYQWAGRVGRGSIGWMAGWIYLACSTISLASVALALQGALPRIAPWAQIIGDGSNPVDAARNAVLLGGLLVVASTLVNVLGVRLLARINNVGVFAEMAGVVVLIALLATRARRGVGVVLETQGRGDGLAWGYLGPFLASALVPSFVMYGFDTAGALAEETDDPRRNGPRAILGSLAAVGLAGALLILGALMAAPDLRDPGLGRLGGGMATIVQGSLGSGWGDWLLADMVLAIAVCTLTVHAAAVRLVFAMARDNGLPGSESLASLAGSTRTPRLPAVLLGLGALAILAANANLPQVVEVMASVAIAWANLAYLCVTVPQLARRLRDGRRGTGWQGLRYSATPVRGGRSGGGVPTPATRDGETPRKEGEPSRADGLFSLGRWGLPVNALAVIWGVLIVINVGWPRAEVYGDPWYRRFAAPMATAAMLGAGWACRGRAGRRGGGVLGDHRAPALGVASGSGSGIIGESIE